ncbi:MAG: GC-type dockerin domain-anchored protein [Phycisphaerales bacterium]
MKGTNRLSLVAGSAVAVLGVNSARAQCVSGWDAVGNAADSALGGIVQAMTVWDHDGALATPKQIVATGSFATAGGNPSARIVRWDGTAWQQFATGFGASGARSLVVRDNGDLVVAGEFTSADGQPGTGHVATWTPGATTFGALGNGITGGVALSVVNYHGSGGAGAEQIVVGGQAFSGGLSRIGAWDGSTWDSMNGGMSSLVGAMAVLANGDLVAGGSFVTAGGVDARSIARWDGSAWHPLAEGMGLAGPSTLVRCMLALPNGDLIVGGSFTVAGPADNVVNYIARWDGTSWHSMGGGMSNGTATNPGVYGLALLPNGDIVAGGNFGTAGTATAHNVARWDGTSWHAVGSSGMNGIVYCFTQLNGELYAGGDFTTADGHTATRFAKFAQTTRAVADIGAAGGVPGNDGALDNNDFIAFITYFFAANPVADMGVAGGQPGSDGAFNNNDFIAFINAFFNGCPV